MKSFLKKLTKIKAKNLPRSFWIFMLITMLLGSILQVGALYGNPALDESVIESTPADKTIWSYQGPEEIALLTDGQCPGYDSRLGGVGGSLIRSVAEGITLNQDNATCATIAFNNGDPRMLAEILNDSHEDNLIENLFAINAMVLDQRPASGAEFVESNIYALLNSNSVSAQDDVNLYYRGTGFDLLRPIQAFWSWSVALVYSLLIFVIIIVAFGIMFRSSLNGGLAVALQQSIPNIALAMILVPLSYAITGLFIDGITVGVNVTHQFLLGAGSPGRGVYDARNEDFPTEGRFGGVVPYDFEDRGLHADDMRVSWLYSGQVLVTGDDSLGAGVGSLAEGIGMIFGITSFLETLGIGHWFIPIVNFLLGLLLLITGFRIFAKLIVKYIMLILMPLFAPFIFAGVALPGSGTKIITWYAQQMGSCTLAYIVTYAMTLLTIIFSSSFFLSQLPDAGVATFVPPLTAMESALVQLADNANTSTGSGFSAAGDLLQFTFIIVAFGIYMLIPKTLDNIDAALGVGKLPEFFGDIFQSTKDSVGLARATGTRGAQAWNSRANVLRADKRIQNVQSAMNLVDRARGLKPGEEGSYLSRRRAQLQSQLASTEQRRAQAIKNGNYIQARNLANQANALRSRIGSADTALGGDGQETEGANKLEAEIAFGASKGLLVMDGPTINALRDGGGVLLSGSIGVKSEVPLFPVKNAPVGRAPYKNAVGKVSSTAAKLIPSPVTNIPADKIGIINKGDNAISGVKPNAYFEKYYIDQNIFKLNGLSETDVQIYINGDKNKVAEVGDDGKSFKMKLFFKINMPLDDFLKKVGNGSVYKAENEIQIELRNAFGLSTTIRTNKFGFNIQPQFANIPGLQDNPTYTV